MKNIVGNILQELLNKKGSPSKRHFAEMLSISPKTLYNVMEGSSELTLTQITKASEILNYNIVKEYYNRAPSSLDSVVNEPGEEYKKTTQLTTVTLNLGVETPAFRTFSEFMSDLGSVAKKYHIHIL